MFQLPIAAITGMGKFSKSLIKFRALATNAPTIFAGIFALSLRSAQFNKLRFYLQLIGELYPLNTLYNVVVTVPDKALNQIGFLQR